MSAAEPATASAKDIRVLPISSKVGRRFLREHHYSGKVTNNSQLHLGVYLNGRLEGAMSFGPPLDRSKVIHLVEESGRENMLELNRLAFTDALPRNSESRAIRVAMRLIRKHSPAVKWIISFADATQCGDGTIYRASGFVLTGIKESYNLARLTDGTVLHKMTLESSPTRPREEFGGRSYFDVTGGKYAFRTAMEGVGAEILPGYQLRYIGFVDPTWRERLTVDALPFSAIDEAGAGMYLGERRGGV